MSETIYFNTLKAKQGKYGIKLTAKSIDLIAEIEKNTNAKGYINLEVFQKKEADKYGYTHGVKVDTYEPKPKDESPF